jgi:N-acetylglucosaminylphosphatidylinositol deacetylase
MQILTFDAQGVSGHPNHIAVHRAMHAFARSTRAYATRKDGLPSELVWYELQTVPRLQKFSGLIDVLLSEVSMPPPLKTVHRPPQPPTEHKPRRGDYYDDGVSIPDHVLVARFEPWLNHAAMVAHWSQFVWFRRLFVLFSRYTFVNTLRRVHDRE